MSARILIPSDNVRVFNRVRLCATDYEANVIRYIDRYSYYDDTLKISIKFNPYPLSPDIYASLISNFPIFTIQEVHFLQNYKGKVEIECNDVNYILHNFNHIWVSSPIIKDYERLVGTIFHTSGLFRMYNGVQVWANEIQPDLYIGRCPSNKIVITKGENITKLDLFSSLVTDTGENYSMGYEIGTWYGVIIKQVRKCTAKKSIKTVVVYGSIDDNNIYLYDDLEVSDPSLILPRYFLSSKPFSGREKLEICVEPLKKWD